MQGTTDLSHSATAHLFGGTNVLSRLGQTFLDHLPKVARRWDLGLLNVSARLATHASMFFFVFLKA